MDIKILLFSNKKNIFCDYAEIILKSYFSGEQIISLRGVEGDRLDEEVRFYNPDYVISFVSPWIIPKEILNSAKIAAINFHPGSPEYPGSGCCNFAIYEQCRRYGVTVHHMNEKADTGDIIATSYFDVAPFDTVETLKLKSMNHLLCLFEKIISCIALGGVLPKSDEKWKRKPFTKSDMYKMFEINPINHDEEEVKRRIMAAGYSTYEGAYINVYNQKFYLRSDEKPIFE